MALRFHFSEVALPALLFPSLWLLLVVGSKVLLSLNDGLSLMLSLVALELGAPRNCSLFLSPCVHSLSYLSPC